MLPSTVRTTLFFIFILFSKTILGQSDDCATPSLLTPATSCSNISGTLYLATNSGITSSCGTTYDVWYYFTTPASCTSVNIDVADIAAGGSLIDNTNAFVQAFSGANCATTSVGVCTPIGTTLALTGLTPLTTYHVRVFTTTNPNSGNAGKWDYNICITYIPAPSNDDCSTAITLTSGTTNSSGSVWLASASSTIPVGCATGDPDDDVWYKITSPGAGSDLSIALSSVGSNLNSSGAMIQVFSGGCGSLTSVACGTTSLSTQMGIGTYYIRIYSFGTGSIGGTSAGSTFSITATVTAPVIVTASRMNEVYKQTILSGSGVLQYPWELTYGPDDKLWITESRGYKVYRMDPNTGIKTTVLDLNSASTDLSAWGADSLRAVSLDNTSIPTTTWNSSAGVWPQGGLAGLAIHPKFGDGSGHDYVYVSYVHRYLYTLSGSAGIFFRNKIVRFTYNSGTGKLGSPAVVCDTIPGGQDHNSQRMIIAPVTPGGTYYLFYAAGDMGSGQYSNRMRPQNAQNINSYEGKILRFNLEPVTGSWIPVDNPYSSTSAVYSIGIRNNQGFAYDTATNKLYGSSHGPFSDDEINIIESGKNYGHPLVVGFAADGNANGTTAGNAPGMSGGSTSTCPVITSESSNAATIGASYKDPFFSGYVNSSDYPSISTLWNTTTGGNALWPTETWSGIDIYSNKVIPGWKRSLVTAALKWGRLMRLKLGAAGGTTLPNNNVNDTISYFNSKNRFRDLAFAPNGKDIFVIMDNNAATSGPGQSNPVVPQCAGCVQKYSFLGYVDASGKSSIPTSIDVTDGTVNTCNTGTTITIDASNNNYWVPITGPDGNIMAEIYANGNNLGTVTSSFYQRAGPSRMANGKPYLNRNIRITPQNQPSSAVKIRLYISKAEYDTLNNHPLSLVSAITDVKILKNNDVCGSAIASTASPVTMLFEEAHGANGYMLQGSINSFSSFYFGNSSIALPLQLLTFRGSLQNNAALLSWETANEVNVSHFVVERSIDNRSFTSIGNVSARRNNTINNNYSYTDNDVINQSSSIVYYRLKMVDIDGNYTYSSIVVITLPYITGKITIFPNPATHEIKITIGASIDGKVQYNLSDNTGRVVMQNTALLKRGNNVLTVKIDKLSAGFYYLNVSCDGINQRVKLEKL